MTATYADPSQSIEFSELLEESLETFIKASAILEDILECDENEKMIESLNIRDASSKCNAVIDSMKEIVSPKLQGFIDCANKIDLQNALREESAQW